MHAPASFQVGGSNPGALIICSGAAAAKVSRPGLEPPIIKHASVALPLDQRRCYSIQLPHCLKPVEQKLLTPPPHPPPPKSDIQF